MYKRQIPNAVLELRTKSTQIRSLLNLEVQSDVVIAYSLSPERIAEEVEHGAPSLAKRVQALKRLQQRGWRIGLRFDPIIWHQEYVQDYQAALKHVFEELDPDRIDSVTLGGFRLPKNFYKTMHKLYPEHWLLNAGLQNNEGMVTYRQEIEAEVLTNVEKMCSEFVTGEKIFSYASFDNQ